MFFNPKIRCLGVFIDIPEARDIHKNQNCPWTWIGLLLLQVDRSHSWKQSDTNYNYGRKHGTAKVARGSDQEEVPLLLWNLIVNELLI